MELIRSSFEVQNTKLTTIDNKLNELVKDVAYIKGKYDQEKSSNSK